MSARQLSTSDFCESCLNIDLADDGSLIVKDILNSPGYRIPIGYSHLNGTIKLGLEKKGGCPRCINTAKNATADW